MKKFFTLILTVLCVAGMATAANLGNRQLKTSAPKAKVMPALRPNASQMTKTHDSRLVVSSMRKADGNPSIEGLWNFYLGDYYFQTSTGPFYWTFEATLDGNELWFEDPTDMELPFLGVYNASANTVAFNKAYLGSVSGYQLFQDPYIYNWVTEDLDSQSIVATYNPQAGTLTFEEDNGIAWAAYTNAQGNGQAAGYFSIYDMLGAEQEAEQEPVEYDEVQEGLWVPAGTVTFVDAWILPSYSMGGVQINPNDYPYEVELQQSVLDKNLYRLWEPFKNSPLAELNQSTYHGQIQLDLSDPNYVEVVACGLPSGFKNNNGEFFLSNQMGWLLAGGYPKDLVIEVIYEGEPADTYINGVVTVNTPIFDFNNDYSDGYSWNNNPYSSIITFPATEETPEELGKYTIYLQKVDLTGEKEEAVEVEATVSGVNDNYYFSVAGDYFDSEVIPFSYDSTSGKAVFSQYVLSELLGDCVWVSGFNLGNTLVAVEDLEIPYTVEGGFTFNGTSGLGWFVNTNKNELSDYGVTKAYLLLNEMPGEDIGGGDDDEKSITIGEVRYTVVAQEDNTATAAFVIPVSTEGLGDDAEIDILYTLNGEEGEDGAVTDNQNGEYTLTVSGLEFDEFYTIVIYATSGDLKSEGFEIEFNTLELGVTGIGTDATVVRYFNLQGVEVKNPQAGEILIRLEGSKAVKTVVR